MKTRVMMGLAAVLGMVLAGCSTEDISDLGPGDCFNIAIANTYDTQEISQVPTVDCAKEHTAEVFLVTNLTPSFSYWDEDAIFDLGAGLCMDAFETYVGVDFFDDKVADLDIFVVYPLEAAWMMGERGLTCALVPIDNDEKLTGSQKNAFVGS